MLTQKQQRIIAAFPDELLDIQEKTSGILKSLEEAGDNLALFKPKISYVKELLTAQNARIQNMLCSVDDNMTRIVLEQQLSALRTTETVLDECAELVSSQCRVRDDAKKQQSLIKIAGIYKKLGNYKK